ncbi:MAG TPA: hypothetical protein DHV14_07000 [Micrococcales bacterium]|uniref:hypothetical protein n=1 Tax=Miniimonas TaxID=947525 RepID=UPI000D52A403|nr:MULTISPECIES: hypothetical protein [Miniimonas]HCX84869.1 hypothetical protein [Micrococcales bacterium]
MTTTSTPSRRRRVRAAAASDGAQPPVFSPRTRTLVYVVGLAVTVGSVLVMTLAGVWFPDVADKLIATAGGIGTAFGALASAMGVAYRPASLVISEAKAED